MKILNCNEAVSRQAVTVISILFLTACLFCACQRNEEGSGKQPSGAALDSTATSPSSAAPAAPSPEDIAWCEQFRPPWGDEVWENWWRRNPEAGEKWFTETPERMKSVDFQRIAKCTHIENMLVAFAPLKDLKPFEKLTALKRLDIRFAMGVSDLTPLSGLHNLEFLGLWGTSVSDLSPLIGLDSLKEINARMTKISDLKPLLKMKSITTIDLLKAPVSDISPLAQIPRITEIMTCSTLINDLSPLYPVAERITYLDLCNVPFRDFAELKRFKNLKTIKLWGLPLGSLDILSELRQLEYIDLTGAVYDSLTPLEKLPALKKVDIIGNKVNDAELESLKKKLPELEVVTQSE